MSVLADVFRKIGSFGESLIENILPLALRAFLAFTLLWHMAGMMEMMNSSVMMWVMYIVGICFLFGLATRILSLLVFVCVLLTLFGVDVMGMMMPDMMRGSMMMKDMMMSMMLSHCVLMLAASLSLFAVGAGRFSVDAVIDSQV